MADIVDIYNGIQTSAEKVYKIEGKTIVSEDENYVKFRVRDKEYMIERGILRLYFKPTRTEQGALDTYSDINQVKVNYNIFPYDENGSFITKNIMETQYPHAWEYLLEHKDTLLPKSLGGNRDVQPIVSDKDEWYRYGRSQAITSLNNRDKIIVGVNRKKDDPLYLMDKTHYLIASGGTAGYVGISLKEDSEYQLEYIHAWLSHPWTDWYLQSIGSDFEGGFIARGTYTLPMVPFIKLDFADKKQKELYDQVVSNTRRIGELNEELLSRKDKATQNVLEKEKNRLIKKNEEMITKVYQQKFLGDHMKLKEDSSVQKLRGAYYTPLPLAEMMVKLFASRMDCKNVLEPSCGDGVLFGCVNLNLIVLKRYASIDAVEIDGVEAKKSRRKNESL